MFGTKTKMTRQEKEILREAISKEATMPKEKVPITKTGKSGAGYLLATEKYVLGFGLEFRANVR